MKEFEESIKNMVKNLFQEHSQKQEQTLIEMMTTQQNAMLNELKEFKALVISQQPGNQKPPDPFVDLSKPSGSGYQLASRFTKIEFPMFDDDDLEGRLFRCERFFQIDFTLENAKIKLASIHMEGRAPIGINLF